MITPGPQPVFHGHVDTLGSLRDPSRRSDHESVGLARRPRPGPDSGRTPAGSLVGSPSRVDTAPVVVAGLAAQPTPCLRGRPSPTPGHARPRRDRHCRVPARLSGGPDHQQRGDHKLVASVPNQRVRPQVREARRASRNAPTPSVVLQPGRRHTAARNARNDSSRSDGESTGASNGPVERISEWLTRGQPKSRQPRQLAPGERQPASCPSASKVVHRQRLTASDEHPARLTWGVLGDLDSQCVEQRACQRDNLVGADSRAAQDNPPRTSSIVEPCRSVSRSRAASKFASARSHPRSAQCSPSNS